MSSMLRQAPEPRYTLLWADSADPLVLKGEDLCFRERPMKTDYLAFLARFKGLKGAFSVTVKVRGPSSRLVKGTEMKGKYSAGALLVVASEKVVDGPQLKVAWVMSSEVSGVSSLDIMMGPVEFEEEGLHHYEVYFANRPDPIVRFPFNVTVRPEAVQ